MAIARDVRNIGTLMQVNPLGLFLITISAIAGGGIALPLKKRRTFELENIYVLSTALAMVILPLTAGAVVAPQWLPALRAVGIQDLTVAAAFGIGWGAGGVLFGYGVNEIGMSIGYSAIMGANIGFGALIPLLVNTPVKLLESHTLMILLGIAGCVVGVIICGRARCSYDSEALKSPTHRRLGMGLAICIASGALSSCANLGFTSNHKASVEAERLGTDPAFSSLVSWLPVLWGASIFLFVWFGGLQVRNKTWHKYLDPAAAHDWAMSITMGILSFLAAILYGIGANLWGRFGSSVGWALAMALTVISANVFGFLTHEWTAVTKRVKSTLYIGLAVIIGSVVLLAAANASMNRTW